MIITNGAIYGDAPRSAEGTGRICFIISHVWTAVVFWRFFAKDDGAPLSTDQTYSQYWFSLHRYAWYALTLMYPLVVALLAATGYTITAIDLSVGLLATIGVLMCGVTFYWMALRLLALRKRKLALAEAIERRRARREAAASKGQESSEGPIPVDAEEDDRLDLDSIGEQTRQLLRLLSILVIAVAILTLWSDTVPLISALDKISLGGGLTLLELAKAVLIGVVTWVAVRDLPGFFELWLRQSPSIDAGTRYAISTLCQYALAAIGILWICAVMNVDWSKFGWIAAALSVGIGFGLQEVVANFVCGSDLVVRESHSRRRHRHGRGRYRHRNENSDAGDVDHELGPAGVRRSK